ncbi:polysaccharide lyase [Flaviaesturariibacter amylovorans]|uniref:Polysaccharide lyase 14 domain-containing protein n=1 Tax=Flaviaesturariibacter amylovorans TaxID=1084520 RepID=A0ABP8HE36_9BACT
MKKITNSPLAVIASLLLASSSFVGCTKENLSNPDAATTTEETTAALEAPVPGGSTALATTTTTAPTTTTTPFNLSVTYAGRANSAYGLSQASPDYKNVSYWMGTNTSVEGGTLRTKLTKNVVGISGGTLSKMDVPDAREYQLTYSIKFDNDFDFSYGGKVGFGFLIGNGYTGGTPGWDGNGGSARLMWYKQNGRVFLKPYIYHKDQPGTYGNDFGKSFPATGSLQKGVWYTVKMYVKANNGSNTDGRFRLTINGVIVMDQAIRWTTNDANRLVKHVVFETFRGGAESYWQSATDGNIYFNNVKYTVLKY